MKYLSIILSVFLISCATPYVGTDYDRDFNFSNIKTYKISPIENQSVGQIDLQVFSDQLDFVLQNKGYVKANTPDIEIEIISSESISKDPSASVGVGGGSYGGGIGGGISVGIPINIKKLNKSYIVNMYNAQDELIWQGIYEAQKGMNADKQKIAEQAVEKLMKNFPPKL